MRTQRDIEVILLFLTFIFTTSFVLEKTDGGNPLKWQKSSMPIKYKINQNGVSGASFTELESAVNSSFKTWEDVPTSFITFEYDGTSSINKAQCEGCPGNNVTGPATNLLVWLSDNWGEEHGGSETIGLTTAYYNSDTGEIIQADIEFNAVDYSWAIVNNPQNCPNKTRMDIQNIVTHEIGHFIGLDHNDIEDSVMYPTVSPCEVSKRTLHQDDIDGVSYLYPVYGIPEIKSITPSSAKNTEDNINLNITGSGFIQGFDLYLEKSDVTISSIKTQFISSTQITGTFNFLNKEPGVYNVVVVNEPSTRKLRGVLNNGFEVIDAQIDEESSGCGCSENYYGKRKWNITNLLTFLLTIYFLTILVKIIKLKQKKNEKNIP